MKTFENCCADIAKLHGLGNSLVTGHKQTYFKEAAELYLSEFKSYYRTKLQNEIDQQEAFVNNHSNTMNPDDAYKIGLKSGALKYAIEQIDNK